MSDSHSLHCRVASNGACRRGPAVVSMPSKPSRKGATASKKRIRELTVTHKAETRRTA